MKKWLPLLMLVCAAWTAPLRAEEGGAPPDASKTVLKAEVKIGTGIENREVTGEAESFPVSTVQLVGWSRVTGATQPAQIIHVWKLNGQEFATVPLAVKSSPYRTYSRVTVQEKPGKWTLEVQDIDKTVIGSKEVELAAK